MSASVWKRSSFYQIGEVILGGTPSTKKLEYWNGDIPFVTPNDLSDTNSPFIAKTVRNITKLGLSKSSGNLLLENTLVISTRAPIGYMAVTLGECVTNQGCKSIVFDENQYPLFHYYNTHNYIAKMKSLGSGTTFAEISKSDLEKIKVVYPQSLAEQKHISDILSSCDSVIQNTQKVIDKYKAIKQGMMHDLFTRGLTKDGKLRPSYQEAPELYKPSELGMIPKEWSETAVIEIGEVVSGGTPSTKNTEFWNGSIPFVTPNDLSENKTAYIYQTERYITDKGLLKSSAIELPLETLIISSRAPIGYLAIAICKCVTNQGCKSLIFSSTQDSLFHFYNFKRYVNKMKSLGSGTTFAEISKKDVEKLVVSYPKKSEQIAIAKRLSSIDSAIQKEEAMLAKYKNIKTGLMARLLTPPQDAQIIDETEE